MASMMQGADAATDQEISPDLQRAGSKEASLEDEDATMDDYEVDESSPEYMLMSLRVSEDAERQPLAEDLYFAGRLAATCVILMRDEQLHAAKVLGQWSVDLVGKRHWNKMVDYHSTAPRDDNDNGA